MKNTSARNQRQVIIQHCREYRHINTTEANDELGIMRLAARISELKDLGYVFHKDTINTIDRTGTRHRGVAKYFLVSEPKKEKPEATSDQTNETGFQISKNDNTANVNKAQTGLNTGE